MNKICQVCILGFMLLFMISCGETTPESAGSTMGSAICACAEKSIELHGVMKKYNDSKEYEQLMDAISAASDEMKLTVKCAGERTSLVDPKEMEENKFKATLKEHCPSMPAQMADDIWRRLML